MDLIKSPSKPSVWPLLTKQSLKDSSHLPPSRTKTAGAMQDVYVLLEQINMAMELANVFFANYRKRGSKIVCILMEGKLVYFHTFTLG